MSNIAAPALLLTAFVLGCSPSAPTPSCAAGACRESERGYDAKSYELIGRFDWARQRLVATERVTIVRATTTTTTVELDAAVEVKHVRGMAREPGATADGEGPRSTAAQDPDHAISSRDTDGDNASDRGARDGEGSGGVIRGEVELAFTSGVDNLLRIDVSALGTGAELLYLTIEYEAAVSDALRASTSRDDDPVTARVVYTDSEPFDGMYWLPANHRPADRAEWKVELTVEATENVIANGARTKDEVHGPERIVRYEMTDPIPTYTMAFAAGELEHRDRAAGRVPLSVWYRRGLLFEADEMLDLLSDAMATFENLLGAYPWATYAVVLLPEFSGGMENTTITFTAESSGQANPAASLQAHELAHQWFGDWVTVTTFDDVWIKEGMATLLAPEADRARRDAEGTGRLFGYSFAFDPADSIRDRSLVGIAKYTSGPYTRAAWLLTQIRARVGEASFWQSLRAVLSKHALGSVDSETFVRSFGLDQSTVEKVLRSLDEKRVPTVRIRTQPGPATMVTLSLTDPGQTMIAPTTVTVVDGQGRPASSTLVPDIPLTIPVLSGGYLAPDERDVHPGWWASFDVDSAELAALAPLLFPRSDAARTTFATRSAAQQERAFDALIGYTPKIDIAPSDFSVLYAELDSSVARRLAELGGCIAWKQHTDDAWGAVLETVLPTPSSTTWSTGYASCETELPSRLFGAELADLAGRVDAKSASRLVYLSSYDYGSSATLDALSVVATQAPSLQLRDHALGRLSYQAGAALGYSAVSVEHAPRWKDFFRARLADAESPGRFQTVWRAVVGLADDGALTVAAQKLHTVALPDDVQRQVVCDAYAIAKRGRAEAWNEFQQAAQPWDTLGSTAKALLANVGAGCAP